MLDGGTEGQNSRISSTTVIRTSLIPAIDDEHCHFSVNPVPVKTKTQCRRDVMHVMQSLMELQSVNNGKNV